MGHICIPGQPCLPRSLIATETAEWDEDIPDFLEASSWPTYRNGLLRLRRSLHFGELAGLLGEFQYRIVSIHYYRHGFLWQKQSRKVIFERVVPLSGDHHGLSRCMETLHEQLKEAGLT